MIDPYEFIQRIKQTDHERYSKSSLRKADGKSASEPRGVHKVYYIIQTSKTTFPNSGRKQVARGGRTGHMVILQTIVDDTVNDTRD